MKIQILGCNIYCHQKRKETGSTQSLIVDDSVETKDHSFSYSTELPELLPISDNVEKQNFHNLTALPKNRKVPIVTVTTTITITVRHSYHKQQKRISTRFSIF